MPYLTPDTPPEDTVCRILRIPNDPFWLSIVDGALSSLIFAYNFEAHGDYGPDDTAERFTQMYDDFQAQSCEDIMSGCCYDTVETRVNEDGSIEISINGGDWEPSPNDPRVTGVSLPPPTMDTHHTKCDSATNARQHIEDLNLAHSEAMATATTVFELVAVIAVEIAALLFAPEAAPILIPILLATVPALFALGQTAFDAYWTSDNYDIVLCSFYCNILSDGTFDETAYNAVLSDIGAKLPAGVPRDMLYRDLVAMGRKGLNNIASYGSSADADCSSCVCVPCDLDNWHVKVLDGEEIGLETDRTSDWIELEGHSHHLFGGGGTAYVAMITTDFADQCCFVIELEHVSGTAFGAFYGVACDNPVYPTTDVSFTTMPQSDTQFNGVQFRSADPFTVRVHLAG